LPANDEDMTFLPWVTGEETALSHEFGGHRKAAFLRRGVGAAVRRTAAATGASQWPFTLSNGRY